MRLLIVALKDDPLAIPAHFFLQQFAVRIDHFMQPADVGLQVIAPGDDLAHMVLHISSQPCQRSPQRLSVGT